MVVFLTSSFVEYRTIAETGPAHLSGDYDFIGNLQKYWRENSGLLVVSADPDNYESNDSNAARYTQAFTEAGFGIEKTTVLDHRNSSEAFELVRNSDVVILAGGMAGAQNAFFKEISLKMLLTGYPGVIIALSTGTINSCETVYLIPELGGEAVEPGFDRFTDGLGLTDKIILTHSEYLRSKKIGGFDLMEDIVVPDSKDREFYLIDDGSYFLIDGDVTKFFGKGEVLENGALRTIDSHVSESDWNAVMTGGYICVFEINSATGKLISKFTGDFLPKYDVSVDKAKDFSAFIQDFASKIIIERERELLIRQTVKAVIEAEIESMGCFSRTVHSERGGFRRAMDIRIRPLEGEDNTKICIIQDITEMIDRDWMTDILSRAGFLRDAEKCISKLDLSKGYSLLYTNIRGFKTVNDLFGEEIGDKVIFMVRDQIKDVLEPLVLGRLESDHFVAIIKNEYLKAARMKKLTQMTYRSIYKQYDFSVTCGIYHITDTGLSVGLMIDRAKLAESSIADSDVILYTDYTDRMRTDYVNRMILISDLGEAVKNRELISFYQPVVDTITHKVVSAESLVRWNHHDMGMVSPGLFIPALEQSGKVSRVDMYMAENVFGMLMKNSKEGFPLVPVSINLSRVDFYDPTLLDRIKEILDNDEFPEGAAKIEITESAYANLESNALDFLKVMKEKKVRILLDDYGSGMSSLSTLESYEFDTIKLDIGFVRKIGQSDKAETIIRSTINMAHAFGADVIAEGVENEQQLAFLSDAGCDMIQGYYFYRPMPEDEFCKIVNNPTKTEMILGWGKD
ncbi:MAG: EAL domain-containing protein [Lachnospiraceae bacterium]|nr:EAL domain-containing protein [Lachnospiraceae bacterium]